MDSIDVDQVKTEPRYAGFWIRFGASLLDGLCMAPITLFGMFYNNTELKMLEIAIAIPIVTYLYKLLMEYKFGASLGKMMVKIKVVNNEGGKINFNQAFGRSIPWLLSTFSAVFSTYKLFEHKLFAKAHSIEMVQEVQLKSGGDEMQWILFGLFIVIAITIGVDARKQGFHDKTAGTLVVYK